MGVIVSEVTHSDIERLLERMVKQKQDLFYLLHQIKIDNKSKILDLVADSFTKTEMLVDKMVASKNFNYTTIIQYLNETCDSVDSEINNLRNASSPNFSLYFFEIVRLVNSLYNRLRMIYENFHDELNKKNIININKNSEEIKSKLEDAKLLTEQAKSKSAYELYNADAVKFKKIARLYEFSFYVLVLVIISYFFGVRIYIEDFDLKLFKIIFPSNLSVSSSIEFYIQKLSLIIISTTLVAFILRRSFTNRRLSDESLKIAKEFDGLSLFIATLPDEMKDKIRFDLTYKYFGNGIHHESYTGGENLMHESIKANTDFIKAMKDLSPKVEVPKEDKTTKDAA